MDFLTPDRVKALLSSMLGARVLVVGDLMVDRYVFGSVDRVSPEAPVPVVNVESERAALGGAANVAANIAGLGVTCAVVGCAAQDEAGRMLRAALEALGVRTDGIVETPDRPTTVKTRVMAGQHQIVRFDHEIAADIGSALAEGVVMGVRSLAESSDVLVMEDYDKGVLVPSVVGAALEACGALGIPSVVDPKRRNFFGYAGATWLKPNEMEFEDAMGACVRPDDQGWMEEARDRLGCEHLLVTLGARGVSLMSRDCDLVRVPAVARSVFDVSGAGDTVTAAVASALAAGATSREAAVLANYSAAIGVAKAGVATVSAREIREHLDDHRMTREEGRR